MLLSFKISIYIKLPHLIMDILNRFVYKYKDNKKFLI